jgi:hypothetical protein
MVKLFEQVTRRLEARLPDSRSIFLTTAFVNSLSRESPSLIRTEHDHSKCLAVLLEQLIDSLDDVESYVQQLRAHGEKHAQVSPIMIAIGHLGGSFR